MLFVAEKKDHVLFCSSVFCGSNVAVQSALHFNTVASCFLFYSQVTVSNVKSLKSQPPMSEQAMGHKSYQVLRLYGQNQITALSQFFSS